MNNQVQIRKFKKVLVANRGEDRHPCIPSLK